MQTPSNKLAWHAIGRVLAVAAVAVAITVYAALVIRPPLIYSAYGVFIDYPALPTGTLAETLGHPGGAASYLAAILAQLYYYPWVGGVVVAVLALLLGAGFERLAALCREGRHTPWPILLAPPLAVVAIHNRYVMVLDVLVGLALGVWAAVLMCRVAGRRPWVAAIASAVLAGLLWQAAGGAAMVFALTVSLYIALAGRCWMAGLVPAVVTPAAVWVGGVWLAVLTGGQAFLRLTPFAGEAFATDAVVRAAAAGLFAWGPVLVVGSVVAARWGHKVDAGQPKKQGGRGAGPKQGWLRRLGPGRAAERVLAVGLVAAVVLLSPQVHRKRLFEALHNARNERWADCVEAIRRIPLGQYDFYCNHLANRALCRLGTLTERMFCLPQGRPALLLLTADVPNSRAKFALLGQCSAELGHLNLAQRMGYEALEEQGPCPWVLELLATIHAAKGQPEAARVLYTALARDVVHHNRGRAQLAMLDKDAEMTGQPWVRAMKANMWGQDHPYGVEDEQFILQGMLSSNAGNKAAFEYLMAYYLLTRQLEKVAAGVGRLGELGYRRIPTHIEEAVMIYSSMTRRQVPLFGMQMSPQTVQRYNEFTAVLKRLGGDKGTAMGAMAADFGDSYFFYYRFNVSGAGANR